MKKLINIKRTLAREDRAAQREKGGERENAK